MTTLLHTTNTSTLEFDPSVPCIIDTLNSFLMSEEIRSHLEKGLQLALEKKNAYQELGWLGDTRGGEAFMDEDLQWMKDSWLPRAADAGISYIATVLPQGEIAQFAADTIIESIDDLKASTDAHVRYFHDLQSAKEWLVKSLNHQA